MRVLSIHLGKDQENRDKACSRYICAYLILDAINSLAQDTLNLTGGVLTVVKVIFAIGLVAFLFQPILGFRKEEWERFVFLEVIILFLYLWSLALGAPFKRIKDWIVTSMAICVPLAVCALAIRDKQVLYRMLLKCSWVVLAILAINMLGNNTSKNYSMHFSYGVMFLCLLHTNEFINSRKWWYLPFVAIEIAMVFSYGSRGALVCLVAYVLFKLMTNIKNVDLRVFYCLLLFVGAGLLLFVYFAFADQLLKWLKAVGLDSRTLRLLLKGEFISHDSGRGELYASVIQCIKEKPLSGWGIRGAVPQMGHPYPHQYFLEFWLAFGIPLGTVLMIPTLWPMRRVLITEKGIEKDLLEIFCANGFVCLMWTNSLFTNFYYAIFMGLCLNLFSKRIRVDGKRRSRIKTVKKHEKEIRK